MSRSESPARIRTLIVDDEPLARDCVRIALERVREVEVMGECADGEEAVAAIQSEAPDLVVLDVQMPDLDGFGVIERIGVETMPAVVFVTAYDEHALRAFEIHALDYVLKPFDDARFQDAVRHAIQHIHAQRAGELGRRLTNLLRDVPPGPGMSGKETSAEGSGYASRILVKDRDRYRFVETDRVDWFQAAGNYVRLHVGDETHLVRATLSGMLERLDPSQFVRIHRSTIVNVDRIREVQPWVGGDYIAILNDGENLRISRNYRDGLLKPMA